MSLEELARARAELRVLADAHKARSTPRAGHGRAYLSEHDAWVAYVGDGCAGQRAFLRSVASVRVIVAGRQSGKTHQAAEESIRLILKRPKSESCLLMPTYKSTKGAIRHIRRALSPLPEGKAWTWREVDKCFRFANGATLYLRTADDKSGVPTRGLTLDGVLWVDEASFVPRSAWEAAHATQAAVADPHAIITTTPRGRKTWVFDLCQGADEDDDTEWFRFRTTDSPYHNPRFVEKLRRNLGRQRADEELDAVFLGDTDMPFHPDDLARAFAGRKLPVRGERMTLGLDLAKKQDYTVLTLMNEFGEVWVLDRFRAEQLGATGFWPKAKRRIVEQANKHEAVIIIDIGSGGGFGGSLHDFLTEEIGTDRVFGVRTGNVKIKAQLIEDLIADFEADRIQISDGPHTEELRHELTFFPRPERRTAGGVEQLVYVGADMEADDHDDTVISLCLARWGSRHAWTQAAPADPVDLSGYVKAGSSLRSNVGGSGYRFGLPGGGR